MYSSFTEGKEILLLMLRAQDSTGFLSSFSLLCSVKVLKKPLNHFYKDEKAENLLTCIIHLLSNANSLERE